MPICQYVTKLPSVRGRERNILAISLSSASGCRTITLAIGTVLLVLASAVAAEPTRLIDTDMPGFDYRHFDLPRASPRLCQEACLSDQVCRAWTFVRPKLYGIHAACWLKNRVPKSNSDTCCVSGLR